jgi:hypothetical protein
VAGNAAEQSELNALRARRIVAMSKTFGFLKDKNVFPKDGLAYEREVRDEW